MTHRVLITGGSGFVGGEFQRWFAANSPDSELTIIDTQHPVSPVNCRTFFQLEGMRYDLVIHLAAIVGGRATIEGDQLAVATDLGIDSDFWQWVRAVRPYRVVYFSSSAAYPIALQGHDYLGECGHLQGSPAEVAKARLLREDQIDLHDLRSPDLSYGLVKLMGEYQAELVRSDDVKVHVFRPFSGYGATQSMDYPVPAIVDRARFHADPLEIWSDSVRDFIHISDVVAAVMSAVDQGYQEPVNLCTGVATSFSDLARLAQSIVNPRRQPEIKVLSGQPTGVHYRVGDPSNMLRFYSPKVTLREGLRGMLA